jgi:Family of unknown function (DUF6527)
MMSWLKVGKERIWENVARAPQRTVKILGRLFSRNFFLIAVEGQFPAKLKKRMVYVLTEDQVPWQAAMICPCGCKAVLELNLLPDERPRWSYASDNEGRATLKPSVWRQVGCRSHFLLTGGKIQWV